MQEHEKKEREKSNKLRPLRLRVHVVRSFLCQSPLRDEPFPLNSLPPCLVLGDLKASVYNSLFGYIGTAKPGAAASSTPTHRTEPSSEHSEPGSPRKHVPSHAAPGALVPVSTWTSAADILRQGHVFQPSYALFNYRTGVLQSHLRGMLILTVTVHEYEELAEDLASSRMTQLHRIDVPLRRISRPEKVTPSLLAALGVNPSELKDEALEQLTKHYQLVDYAPVRPYLLFPGVPTNVVVKMILSQVTEFPHSLMLGKTVVDARENVLWKHVGVFLQGLQPAVWVDVPMIEDVNNNVALFNQFHRRNSVLHASVEGSHVKNYARPLTPIKGILSRQESQHSVPGRGLGRQDSQRSVKGISRQDSQHSQLSGFGRLQRTDSQHSALAHDTKKKTTDPGHVNVSGFVAWSILPFTDDDENHAGFLEVRSQYDLVTAFRKHWAILIDRALMIYPHFSSGHVIITIDMREAAVLPVEGGIIKVKADHGDSWYFRVPSNGMASDSIKWFKKLYQQSTSPALKPYHSLLHRMTYLTRAKLGDFSRFVDEHLLTSFDEALMESMDAMNAEEEHLGFMSPKRNTVPTSTAFDYFEAVKKEKPAKKGSLPSLHN